jgi:hypothetical protein
MGHEGSVIRGSLMQQLSEYARTAPMPLWVVESLSSDFAALGLYARIASAAALEDEERMCVTVSRKWAEALFQKEGVHAETMSRLTEAGAVVKVAEYKSGKVRLHLEPYPPDIREELEGYRRPGGTLIAAFS